jgi:ferredoxin
MQITDCQGCGQCEEVCPVQAIHPVVVGEYEMTIDQEKCIGCGRCLEIGCGGIEK